jgi:hypothetical protein
VVDQFSPERHMNNELLATKPEIYLSMPVTEVVH